MAVTPSGPQPPTGWQDDPAARFRKAQQPAQPQQLQQPPQIQASGASAPPQPLPQQPSRQLAAPSGPQPQPAKRPPAPAQPAEPPDLIASLEAGLRCIFQPGEVFAQLRSLPAPGYGSMVLATVAWVGAAATLGLMMAVMSSPANIGLIPLALSIVGATVAAVPLTFLGAGILHCLAMLSGGQAGFERSCQIVSMLAVMAPVAAVVIQLQTPFIWLLPTVYLTYLAVRSVEVMHDAPDAQAWIVVGLAGLIAAAGQGVMYRNAVEFERRLGHLANIYSTSLPGQAPSVPDQTPPAVPIEPAPGSEPRPDWQQQGQEPPRSSMDMVQQPSDASGAALPIVPAGSAGQAMGSPMGNPFENGELPSRTELGQMQQQNTNLFSRINQQFQSNPKMMEGMPSEQKAKLQQLMQKANQLANGQGGQDGAQMLQDPNLQKMIADVLGAVSKAQNQGQGQTQSKRRSKRKKAVEEPQPLQEEPLPAEE